MPQQASLLWIFMTKLSTSMVITGGAEVRLIYDSLGFSAPEVVKKDVFSAGWFGISQEVLADYVVTTLCLMSAKIPKTLLLP